MSTSQAISKMLQAKDNQKAVYHSNGLTVTATVNNSGTTYKDYCPKCGQLKHGLFQSCKVTK